MTILRNSAPPRGATGARVTAKPAPSPLRARMSVFNLLPVVAFTVFGWLFLRHLNALDGAAVRAALAGLSVWQWTLALAFTALSFRALGSYDVIIHRVLHTGQSSRIARSAGMKSIALSQSLGFGTLTSALVRWRCLPDLGALACLRLSAVVSVSFMAALVVIVALVVPFSGLIRQPLVLIAGAVGVSIGMIALSRIAQNMAWIPVSLSAKTLGALVLAAAADTAFAAAALWVLWPDAVSFHLLFAAYLIALGAGLLSNSPGGVGAFDLTLLALVPATQDASAMAALLAFRIVYYVIPAGIALAGLIKPAQGAGRLPYHPEAILAHQTAVIHNHPKGALLTLPSFGNDAILGDLPKGMSLRDLRIGDPKVLYKCSARQAAIARANGWTVLRCAKDAILDLDVWTLEGPKKRQLRRALKAFDASGLHIKEVRDMASLAPVALAWAKRRGGERGHSMGRYCPDYLAHQRVFAAYDGPTPVAFASFHTGDIWTLDLMRHLQNVPTGTMHALVRAGIDCARADRALRLSLAAVPAPAPDLPFAGRALVKAAGLIRFKSAFDPLWQPRYMCARSAPRLAATMASLAFAIHHPAPLPASSRRAAQGDNEDFSIAPLGLTCERGWTLAGAYAHDQSSFRSSSNP